MINQLKEINPGLVLEGGASRGVFSAGALDYLMENDFMFPYVVGVSAGACNALSYSSKQIGRSFHTFAPESENDSYKYSWSEAIKNKGLYDMEKLFVTFPNETFPYDFETYQKLDITCEMTVTNVLTGQAEYMSEKNSVVRLCNICRASASLPLVSPMVYLDGVPYLDGGLADSIPVRRALEQGHKKIVVILTRPYGYRKQFPDERNRLYIPFYNKYPELMKDIYYRPFYYNKRMDTIERLEAEGKIFVLRPSVKCPSRTESDYDILKSFYDHGYETMKDQFDAMKQYLGID